MTKVYENLNSVFLLLSTATYSEINRSLPIESTITAVKVDALFLLIEQKRFGSSLGLQGVK